MWYLTIENEENGEFLNAQEQRVDLLEGTVIRRKINGVIVKNEKAGAKEYKTRENAIKYLKLTPYTEETNNEDEEENI